MQHVRKHTYPHAWSLPLLLQAYWLYRPTEVPDTAWGGFKRMQKRTKGRASYKLPGKKQFADEKHSEGQVLPSRTDAAKAGVQGVQHMCC